MHRKKCGWRLPGERRKMFQKKSSQNKPQPFEMEENQIKREPEISNFNLLKELLEFNADKNEVQAANSDWVIIRGGLLRDLFAALSNNSGKSGNDLERVGKKVGGNFVLTMLESGLSLDEVPTILSLLLNQGGWGKTEIEMSFEKKSAVVTMQNCVTARNVKTKVPNCHFLRGYFEGFFGKLFKVETECRETSCSATGELACKFNVEQQKI